MKLLNALKGIGGEYEINRVLGALGCVSYVVGAHAFIAWHMARGGAFDIIAYCAAFPGGLLVAAGATAGAVSLKDRNVASAKIIEQTGAVPTPPPAGPRVLPQATADATEGAD